MDRSKVFEFFDAESITESIHIVGCGAVGSHLAEQLARIGCKNIHLYDFDTVSSHNIANQMFYESDIGKAKVDAVYDMMIAINPELKGNLHKHGRLEPPYMLDGYIFMCADSLAVRKGIVNGNKYNSLAKAIFDFRMELVGGQHYAAKISNEKEIEELLKTLDFTEEEAKAATPRSACNVELSVIYAPKMIVSCGVANFIKMATNSEYKTKVFVNMNFFAIDAF